MNCFAATGLIMFALRLDIVIKVYRLIDAHTPNDHLVFLRKPLANAAAHVPLMILRLLVVCYCVLLLACWGL